MPIIFLVGSSFVLIAVAACIVKWWIEPTVSFAGPIGMLSIVQGIITLGQAGQSIYHSRYQYQNQSSGGASQI